jgi:cell division protein FtsL
VTLQELSWILLCAVLLVCVGLLLGATWTTQALQPKLRQQAEERRRLNAEWVAVRAARSHWKICPRCGYSPIGRDWYFTPTPDGPADED